MTTVRIEGSEDPLGQGSTPPEPTPAVSTPRADAPPPNRHPHSRLSAAWVAVAVAVVLGVALIDFIAQNTRSVRIEFFSASGHMPVAVALLGAALCGAAVVLAVGIGRTAQLRLTIRRQRNSGSVPAGASTPTTDADATTAPGSAA